MMMMMMMMTLMVDGDIDVGRTIRQGLGRREKEGVERIGRGI